MEKNIVLKVKEYNIFAKAYLPNEVNSLKQIIIACHGFAGDKKSSAIKLLADEMIKNGIGVICFDFPGHGESLVDGSKLTINNCIQDVNLVEEYIKQKYNIPISIFATSFGAYITLINILQNNKKYNNIILRSPAIKMANIFRGKLLRVPEEDYKNRGYTKLGFEREIIIPYSFMKELDNIDLIEIYKGKEIPKIHIIQGDRDDIAPIEDTKNFLSLNPNKIILKVIKGADHRMKGDGELEEAIEYSKKIILGDN